MQTIYGYLKQKLYEKNVRIDDIVSRSGVSRTTIYRMMKGLIKPTPQIYKLFIEVLNLDEREKNELDHYIKMIDIDESQLLARKELQKILYQTDSSFAHREDIEFVIYGKEKYLKGYREILKHIEEASQNYPSQLNIKIYNCIKNEYIAPVITLLRAVGLAQGAEHSASIEHVVAFSLTDHHRNILTIKTLLPLLAHKGYAVYFTDEEQPASERDLLENLILIRYTYAESGTELEKYVALSFEENSFSDCYISNEKGFYDFLSRKYYNARQKHEYSITKQDNMESYSETLFKLEASGKSCLLKSNPCYHRVPIPVYRNMLERLDKASLSPIFTYFGEASSHLYNFESSLESLFIELDNRNNLSLKYEQTEVFTKEGMETFAKERRLSDHFSFLPEFSKGDVKDILESLLRKSVDPDDKYKLYITYNTMVNPHMIISAYENAGLLLEYSGPQELQTGISNCMIKQEALAKTLLDFTENYIPQSLAMSEMETKKFIEYLIQMYCE